MGLLVSDGKTRSQRRAEAKALKAKAKLEAKLESKERRKLEKKGRRADRKAARKATAAAQKADRRSSKAVDKAHRAELKLAKENAKTEAVKAKAAADSRTLSAASVKRYLTVARLVAPIAAPVIYRVSISAREQLAAARASRAGVAPEVLRQFSGHGATLSARIATTRSSIDNLSAKDSSPEGSAFAAAMSARLANLATAVDAAEMMPPAQRRNAHAAIDRELSAIDGDILARLGVGA